MLPRRVLGGLAASRAEGVDGTCRALVSLQNALCKPSDTGTVQFSSPWQQHQTRGQKAAPTPASELPLQTGRARMVVLGTGWAAARLIRDINPKLFDFTVISPRNHMVFTPLLASTCVGTLEPRSVALPLTDIQPQLKQLQNKYYAADAVAIDKDKQVVTCTEDGVEEFDVKFDMLAIATGSQGSTFGIPGVEQHAHFLRDVSNATHIRNHLIANWNKANLPTRTQKERSRLLQIVVVGGGPTGVEFAGELSSFISTRARDIRISLVEGAQLLGSFDVRLREYAARKLHNQGIHLIKVMVKEVKETELILQNGDVIPYGLCVWSTGVGPTDFTTSLPFAKTARGRIAVDDCLHAGDKSSNDDFEPLHNIFALGDCCANKEHALPALAQVAEQQGMYLAKQLNAAAKARVGKEEAPQWKPFEYHHLGSMALVGKGSAIVELGDHSKGRGLSLTGFKSWLAWRSAYLTRLGNVRNRLYVMLDWTIALLFGRDVSAW
ncbi:mitochondrial type-II NADH dehydrogenase [Coccomyxa subellipsoidea C-169]|uniref:NADH:ubiquinone reductase (non-electrogenic) n=1 Tax=Coccomyxa subellipsoidea (strain C-169) TaxID=574566 RepID=I0Z0D5_COCSC|nr:mitochondrial type-II NADH dehydrogenase [Coccomyxa subellipsoidea C-169]EIE24104.1 mitochondrial type-II NADH dehydrogenase [Coccomyxa subellipsoidea C-169]|eukprot:XP_005648648.1 mitochondrial type-II NADH dehydrogenase [Coccomyxa subellipsoidea C-169]